MVFIMADCAENYWKAFISQNCESRFWWAATIKSRNRDHDVWKKQVLAVFLNGYFVGTIQTIYRLPTKSGTLELLRWDIKIPINKKK